MDDHADFWQYTQAHPNGCLLYTGRGTRGRYGHVRITYRGRRDYAHRIAWRIHHGEIPPGLVVGHRCDVGGCVAPDHLEVITPQENVRQRDERNRRTPFLPHGTRHWSSKLDRQAVLAIRRARDTKAVSARALATIFQVAPATIYAAWAGQTYHDVTPAPR